MWEVGGGSGPELQAHEFESELCAGLLIRGPHTQKWREHAELECNGHWHDTSTMGTCCINVWQQSSGVQTLHCRD